MEQVQSKKKPSKLLLSLIVIGLVVVGGIVGSASGLFTIFKSPKAQYFLAEKATLDHIGGLFNDRYKDELNWLQTTKTKTTEHTYDISAEWNEPTYDYMESFIQEMVNSASLTIRSVSDPKSKETETELGVSVSGISVDDVKLYTSSEKLLLSLPFLDEMIQLNDADFGKIMKNFDDSYNGDEKLGLSDMMENNFVLSEEDRTYLTKEYLLYLFNELPESAFTSDKETINVHNVDVKTTKIAMNLSEEQVKTLLTNLFKKMQQDEKLKTILVEQMKLRMLQAQIGGGYYGDYSHEDIVADAISEFEDMLTDAIEGIDELYITDGIQSTIWHHSNLIVKRDFSLGIGEYEDEIETLQISGTQLLDKNKQKWDYTFGFTDSWGYEDSLDFKGDLSSVNGEIKDDISITVDDTKISYKGKEELKNNKRTFKRQFTFSDGWSKPTFIWSGSSTHGGDSMTADHEFTISDEEIRANMYNLLVKQQGKVVKKVDFPNTKHTINLGDMDGYEIEEFFEYDFIYQFEDWAGELMGQIEEEMYGY